VTAARPVALAVAGFAVLAAGCSSSTGSPGGSTSAVVLSTPAPSPSTSSAQHCPPAGVAAPWPADAPSGLPVPPGLKITSIQRRPNVVIAFTVADDFHATVRYLLDALPKAGFTLGTGDAEAEEADIPLSRGAERASIKVNDRATCLTGGILALAAD
jgi:hypothetical protein